MENKEKGWILGYDVKSLPSSKTMNEISKYALEKGIIEWDSSKGGCKPYVENLGGNKNDYLKNCKIVDVFNQVDKKEYSVDKTKECQKCGDVENDKSTITFAGITNVYCKKCNSETLDEIDKNLHKNFLKHIKEEIVWYLKDKEVGRCNLPQGTLGGFRDWLAFNEGVAEFDNVNFLVNGEIRMNGKEQLFEGKPYGEFAGKQYAERKKSNYFV